MNTCTNPVACQEIAHRHRLYLERNLPFLAQDHTLFLKDQRVQWAEVSLSQHALQRQVERAVGFHDIMEVIECGEPIDGGYDATHQQWTLVMRGFVADNRPLMVVIVYTDRISDETWIWKVVTMYDPTFVADRWDATFLWRQCFCPLPEYLKGDDDEVHYGEISAF